jgi:hypothetical protein
MEAPSDIKFDFSIPSSPPARLQCDYANQGSAGGVCPDRFFGEDNVEMLAASQEAEVTFVAWKEALIASKRQMTN